MKDIQIIVKEEFEVNYLSKEFKGKVKVFLPVDFQGNLLELLRSKETIILGERLEANWGYFYSNEKGRYNEKVFKSSSVEELQEKMQDIIEKVISKVREVMKRNLKLQQQLPKNEEKIYVIPVSLYDEVEETEEVVEEI